MAHPASMALRPISAAAVALSCLLAACAHAGRPVPPSLPRGLADSVRTERLAEGAWLHTIVNASAPWRAYVLEVEARCVRARALKGAPTALGRTTTSALLAGLPAEARAIAAINADFFLFTPAGVPTNLHVEGGRLLAGPAPKPVFISDGVRAYMLDTVRAEGSIRTAARVLALETWNRPALGRTGVVDGNWGVPFDSLLRRAVVQRLEPVGATAARGRSVAAGVGGATARRPIVGGRYIVRSATGADTLARGDTLLLHLGAGVSPLPVSDTVLLTMHLLAAGDIAIGEAVGGRPLLVTDSAVTGDVETEGNPGFRGLNPRSAVGMNRQGTRLWFAVIDGRRPGYSMGMTLRQTAELMRALGAWRALNLDGGGSSALALRTATTGQVHLANRPSDPTERPVGNAVALQATCGR